MLNLILHPDQVHRLARELVQARKREIGGVLVGEQLAPNSFRLVDFSVQRSGGTETCFVCDPSKHRQFLDEFFSRTGANYSRFNYLGEWHSHPLFSVAPSSRDMAQMQALVDEEPQRRPFALLLVTRLGRCGCVELCPLVFRSKYQPDIVKVTLSPRPPDETTAGRRSSFDRLFRPEPRLEVVIARQGYRSEQGESGRR